MPEKAVYLWGAGAMMRVSIGASLPANEQAAYDQLSAKVRSFLGDKAFSRIWEEGYALTWEQAVAYALDDAVPHAPINGGD